MKRKAVLNRYTTLPVVLDLLQRKRLVLLSPDRWEDRNDALVMDEYRRRKGLKHLHALCFSEGDETIHHWTAFANGTSGCCIEFDFARLVSQLEGLAGVRHGPVKYRKLSTLKAGDLKLEQMPFVKRWPYRVETEYRILHEGELQDSSAREFFEIPVDLRCINRITVNQHMPRQIYETIKSQLAGVLRNPAQRICQSTLYENKPWVGKFRKA